jgi:lipopolysaccharide export system protein LptA
MFPSLRTSAFTLFALLLLACAPAWAKTSDRNQPTHIDAGYQDGDYSGNGKTNLSQGVILTQGTLTITSDSGVVQMRNNQITQASFTGTPVKMRQQLNDGTWMDAVADRIDYDMTTDILILTGNYTVTSAKGTNSGQRMVYNTRTSTMQSGGDGTRVITIIPPRNPQNTATPNEQTAPATTPTTQDKP